MKSFEENANRYSYTRFIVRYVCGCDRRRSRKHGIFCRNSFLLLSEEKHEVVKTLGQMTTYFIQKTLELRLNY